MKGKNTTPARGYGASRTNRESGSDNWKPRLKLGLRWVTYSFWMVTLGTGFYFGGLLAADWINQPVSSVKINGEFTRASKQKVADRIYASMDASYMKLDLEKIQTALQQDPWIDVARVERRWPDQLEVTVIEHKPIARWGEADALNQRGEIIPLPAGEDQSAALEKLPRLGGEEGMELEVMGQYQAISSLLQEQHLVVAELICDSTRSWSLELGSGVLVTIGRDQIMNKMQRFLTVFNTHLKPRWSDLKTIDLRYFNGLAVQWREAKNV